MISESEINKKIKEEEEEHPDDDWLGPIKRRSTIVIKK